MIIGIDTSCYTTSIAVVDSSGNLVVEERRILEVEQGGRGLRQSAALFQHLREGSEVFSRALGQIATGKLAIDGICVSNRPRPQEDSYMPVFLAGINAAKLIAGSFSAPIFYTSHQEGHIMAGVRDSKMPELKKFLAVHLSGGTSEILQVEATTLGFDIKLLGGTMDIHAGQLVDRLGVAMGQKFPCGPVMDSLALAYQGEKYSLKSHVDGANFALSGAETQALKAISQGVDLGAVAQGVFQVICNSLDKALRHAIETTDISHVLLVGGVSGSGYLKARLQKRLGGGAGLYFASPAYSKDNAYGVALLGLKQQILPDK